MRLGGSRNALLLDHICTISQGYDLTKSLEDTFCTHISYSLMYTTSFYLACYHYCLSSVCIFVNIHETRLLLCQDTLDSK